GDARALLLRHRFQLLEVVGRVLRQLVVVEILVAAVAGELLPCHLRLLDHLLHYLLRFRAAALGARLRGRRIALRRDRALAVVAGGAHLFAKHSELGVADDAALTSPKNAPLFGLRLGLVLHPIFAIEAEGVGIPTKTRDTGASVFIIGARGSLVYNIMPGEIA